MKSTVIILAVCIGVMLCVASTMAATTGTTQTTVTQATTQKKSGAEQMLPSLLALAGASAICLFRQFWN
jgi:flagellar basal body-associated protein FliL